MSRTIMTMKPFTLFSGAVAFGALLLASAASADTNSDPRNLTGGRAEVYQQISPDSLEAVSTRDQVLNLGAPNLAPTHIWKVLEHGEKLECLACVPVISKLLYSSNAKTREISAWWLRRRIFGVFGPGQVYEQTLKTLADSTETEAHRVYAANAIGEFLDAGGVSPLSKAVTGDESAAVRAAAVAALERLNSPGESGEISAALGDSDTDVRLAALHAATRINSYTDVAAVVGLISDQSSLVRRRAAETLGVFKAADAVMGLIALASSDQESDPNVRAAAIWALGQIGDPAARDVVVEAQSDSDVSVRSAAGVAARMLRL
jgi:HEAT repeat protein